jgi:phosphoribosyl 1,2-cyclic phosphate phosphodiesterase
MIPGTWGALISDYIGVHMGVHMDVLFLGTAAAEGYPAIFCRCARCEAARRLGGPNLRRRSAALIDGVLLLDCGPDLLAAAHAYGLQLDRVRYLLLTHAHDDHLYLPNLVYRAPGFAGSELDHLEIYGTAPSLQRLGLSDERLNRLNASVHPIATFETFQAGPYTVTALRARHDMSLEPVIYVIQKDATALLYGTDTGPFWPETWDALDALGRAGVQLGAVVLEATRGMLPSLEQPTGHMNIAECLAHYAELRQRGLVRPGAPALAHHFSHNGVPLHEELAQLLAPGGMQPAYDGLRLTIS